MDLEPLPTPDQKQLFREYCSMLISRELRDHTDPNGDTLHVDYDLRRQTFSFGVATNFKNNYGRPAFIFKSISVNTDGLVSRRVDADSVMDLLDGIFPHPEVTACSVERANYTRAGYSIIEFYEETIEDLYELATIRVLDRVTTSELQICVDTMADLLKRATPTN